MKHELAEVFSNFSLAHYATRSLDDIAAHLVPWFEQRRASSAYLKRMLVFLIAATRRTFPVSTVLQTATSLPFLHAVGGDPKRFVLALAKDGPDKLKGLVPALTAEAMKNIGFDVAKPDRHVNRALASFGWMTFAKWRVRRTRSNISRMPLSDDAGRVSRLPSR